MNSTIGSLNVQDFFKGLIVAVLTAIVTFLYGTIQNGEIVFDWKQIAITSLSAALAYIIKNYLTGTEGKFLKK